MFTSTIFSFPLYSLSLPPHPAGSSLHRVMIVFDWPIQFVDAIAHGRALAVSS
jgi:hypothetical protein